MSFLSPWFLLGLLGVAIPLAIHLSRRPKAEKVVFSTIRFLKKTPKKTIFFQRIRQWLLLLLRTAIIALLAVAFARPFLSQAISEHAGWSPRSVVILLDASMSMQYGDAFEKAKKAVLALLDSFQAGDEAALVTFSDGTENQTELTTDLAPLTAFVRNLDSPGFKSTEYLPALRLADQILRSARYPDKTVYLVSDFQRQALGDMDQEAKNLAITDVNPATRRNRDRAEHVILARVRNLGTRPLTETRVTLSIDEKTVDTQPIDLTGRTETIVTFRTKFRERGVHVGAITVEDEFFAPDNTFYFTIDDLRPLRVLSIVDATAAKDHAGENRWFESALGIGSGAPFHLDRGRPSEITNDPLQRYDVVTLLNVGELDAALVERITAYVEQGGSLLIAPAARVTAQSFNRLFNGLIPAVLDQKHIIESGDYLSIAEVNRRHPIIKSLDLVERGDLGAARFHGIWFTKPAPDSIGILGFDNGQAALLEKKVGKGRVLLFTSSMDTQWNNLPRQGWYVPFVHETLRYLAMQEEKKPAYTVGEPVRLRLPTSNAVRVIGPNGTETILTSATAKEVFYRSTDKPGFYEVRGRQEQDVLAVNVSSMESDLSFATPEQIDAALVNDADRTSDAQPASVSTIAAHAEKTQRLWWWVLLAVLCLGLGETFLANRTHR